MPLLTLGLNHRTAPLEIRERTVFAPDSIPSALGELLGVEDVDEAAIISTCNRTEIYCHLEAGEVDHTLRWFLDHHGVESLNHQAFLYRHIDTRTVRHLLRVACGLDSMVLGEPQILGQLKEAYRRAEQAGALGQQLSRLFQHAFAAAKQVRSETGIGSNPVSVAFAAVRMAQRLFTDLGEQTALMIGAGETIELAARHLRDQGIGRLVVANRSADRAQALADQFGAEAIQLAGLGDWLHQADMVVSSTASQLPIIGKGAVESALKQRKHRPMFLVDLAVPRDIEPEVGRLQDVYLYNVDDLETVIDENRRSREEAAKEAEAIVESKVAEFIEWQRSLEAVNTIRQYREQAREISQDSLEKARRMIARGKSTDEALEYLAHTLTNKLLHQPTVKLDRAAREGRRELVEAARKLFSNDSDK